MLNTISQPIVANETFFEAVIQPSQIEGILSEQFASLGFRELANECRNEFACGNYAKVTPLFPVELVDFLRNEVERALRVRGVRRDLAIAATQDTPRKMTNLRYSDLKNECPGIDPVYKSNVIKGLISYLVSEEVHDCPWKNERYIATCLHKADDTHGWHWDDYAYSLLWVLKAPPPEKGGNLQIVPDTSWDKSNPDIANILERNEKRILTKHHATGDIYLFRSDILLHRVTPLVEDNERIVLNMVYANDSDVAAQKTHETMNDLFA